MADTATTSSVFVDAGRRGGRARVENLRRLREAERRVDPDRVMRDDERRALAKLVVEIDDRERQVERLAEVFIGRARQELADKREQLEQLTALSAA